jgi:hypothetical protein
VHVVVIVRVDRHVVLAESGHATTDVLQSRKVRRAEVIDLGTATNETAVRPIVREYRSAIRPANARSEGESTWAKLVASHIRCSRDY